MDSGDAARIPPQQYIFPFFMLLSSYTTAKLLLFLLDNGPASEVLGWLKETGQQPLISRPRLLVWNLVNAQYSLHWPAVGVFQCLNYYMQVIQEKQA